MPRGLAALLVLAVGCHAPPVTSRAGEVHLHQYPSGGHVEALFLDPPTPLAQTDFDSALPVRNPASLTVGDCRMYTVPRAICSPACPSSPPLVDGGPIEVLGLSAQPVELAYSAQLGGYDSVLVDAAAFVPGAAVEVRGLGAARTPRFATSLRLPAGASPTSTIDAGLDAGLELSWTPDPDGAGVRLLLGLTPDAGDGVALACEVDQTSGRFRVPDDLLAHLPPPPRTVQLELSRYRLAEVDLGDGRSVVVHAGFAVLAGRRDP